MKGFNVVAAFVAACISVSTGVCHGATGCTLNDPDRDIRRIFPEATGFRTDFITIEEKGGRELAGKIEGLLGGKLDPIYESLDVAYAYYTVLSGEKVIGFVHGVNQKGKYGGMQIILATDLNGRIMDCYYQKISSPEAGKFRSRSFTDQFKGLSLTDFLVHRGLAEPVDGTDDRVGKVGDPTEKSHEDFAATLRGIMKNLILLNEFGIMEKSDAVMRTKGDGNNEDASSK